MFPSSAWGPHLSHFARWIPSLDAFLDPTVTIAKFSGRRGPRMGMSVTDAVRRRPADLARVWMSLHHLTGGRAVLGSLMLRSPQYGEYGEVPAISVAVQGFTTGR